MSSLLFVLLIQTFVPLHKLVIDTFAAPGCHFEVKVNCTIKWKHNNETISIYTGSLQPLLFEQVCLPSPLKVVPTNRLEKLSVASLIKISNVFFFSFFLLGPKYFYISIATFTLANDLSRSFITDCKFKKIS